MKARRRIPLLKKQKLKERYKYIGIAVVLMLGFLLLTGCSTPTQKEKFMNAKMKEYFRQKLESWKNELLKESSQTLNNLQTENEAKPDMTDRASEEIDRTFELRTRDRERKLINKIDAALRRIEDGTYGYCEETGEPIGLKRLEARPVATLSLDAQEMHEKAEKRLN